MGVWTDEEFEAFATSTIAEYQALESEYGEASGEVMRAIGSAAASTNPQDVANNMITAVMAIGSAAGPIGALIAGVCAGLMKFGAWLAGEWPAAPDYNNRDGLVRTAEAMGFRCVADFAREGWVAANFGDLQTARTPEGGPVEVPRDVAAHFLAPQIVRDPSLGKFVIPDQLVPEAYRRADALLAKGALRIISYQSQVSRRLRYTAICVRVDALPADVVGTLRLFWPLLLEVDETDRTAPRPWFPRNDKGLQFLLTAALQWSWMDAPQQETPGGAPLVARKLAEGLIAATRIVLPPGGLRTSIPRGGVPLARPAEGSGLAGLAVIAALKFLL